MKKTFKKLLVSVMAAVTVINSMFVRTQAEETVDSEIVEGAGVNVEKIDGLSEDFIMGMDISSYVSVTNSGVVFKDFNGNELDDSGFFTLLKDSGINYIRVRVWNDPYDENGNGYGGGNCDIDVAAKIGKLATDAGMKMLIDFHYSDFWADPGRQLAPKAWENFSVDEKVTAIYDYTKESINYLREQGVDIGMIQIGNETTAGFCGESDWSNVGKLFCSASQAIRECDSNIMIAMHFTNPESTDYNWYASMLQNNGVDYDIFASSYYPSWHGSAENLVNELSSVANTYGKKVMIAETSYPYTSKDTDCFTNTLTSQVTGWPMLSVQGQADYMASFIEMISGIGDSAIGVFYWEGAWNSVGSAKIENIELWEKYGSGWASKYADDYDHAHVGGATGGSAVDNQSFFDINGKALASLNVFKYVYTGATTKGSSSYVPEETTTEEITTEAETTTEEIITEETYPISMENPEAFTTMSNAEKRKDATSEMAILVAAGTFFVAGVLLLLLIKKMKEKAKDRGIDPFSED